MRENKCKCDLRTKLVGDGCRYCNPQDYIDHLHDALAAREWVGLTDEEIAEIAATPAAIPGSYVHSFARAIEAKLREKNV
jgi:hypothetical protein